MTTDTRDPQDRNASALEGETTPDTVPHHWVQNGVHETLEDGETRYYAVRQTIERTLADADVLAGRTSGPAEDTVIHVQYVRGDATRAVEREYEARVIETADGAVVDPACLADTKPGAFPASIAVDGERDVPASIQRSEEVVRALDELHDVQASGEEGGA